MILRYFLAYGGTPMQSCVVKREIFFSKMATFGHFGTCCHYFFYNVLALLQLHLLFHHILVHMYDTNDVLPLDLEYNCMFHHIFLTNF